MLRLVLSVGLVTILGLGYLASQLALFQGRAPEYAATVDTPQVALVALGVLVLCVVLSAMPVRNEQRTL